MTDPRYKMEDIILDSATTAQLLDVISYFQNRDLLFIQWGLAERFSDMDGLAVNLYGPPGTGKTMAAHAISDALHKSMICVDYAEIESKYVGETSKKQVLPTYDAYYFDAVFKLFRRELLRLLVPYSAGNNPEYYVSLQFVLDCEEVLGIEGGATRIQMKSHLKSAFPESKLNNYYDNLAQVVLDHAVDSGKAHTVEGPEGYLYVVNDPPAGCKMVRREISLD